MIPEELKKDFEIKDVHFEISKFEEYMLNDIYQYDESSKIKLNRDVSKDFFNEILMYKNQKRNIRYVLKGETRSGKSYIALKIGDIILDKDHRVDFEKDIDLIVCGSQIEYRQKLKDAEFGDFYLVDENLFVRAGLGTNIEHAQLQDYNRTIAKKNISLIFIAPDKFINVNATLGLSTYGRDPKNWLSRVLVYKFKDDFPYLIGYAVVDVGDLYRKYGCYVYKEVGGCTNPNKKLKEDIPERFIKHSGCITEGKIHTDKQVCPFYEMCKHPLSKYEHKKDTWIEKELKGGLDERTHERYKLSLQLISTLNPYYDEEKNSIVLKGVKNAKDLKNRVRLKLPQFTNTKMGIGEYDELIEIIKTNCDPDMLKETLKALQDEELNKTFNDLGLLVDNEQDVNSLKTFSQD